MKLTKKHQILIGIGIIIFFLLISAGLAYFTDSRNPIIKSFKQIYPAAIVGGKFVSVEDSDEFMRIARLMESKVDYTSEYNNFIAHKKSEVLLKKLGIKLDSDAVSDEYTFFTKGNEQSFQQLLAAYFDNDKNLFRQNVVYPSVVEAQLRIKYNSDYNLNKAAYQKAEGILEQLNAGAKFEDLAKANSDDKQSAQFGGDLGFAEHGQILPELEKQIAVAKTGEVHDLIVTRDGYEIVLPVEVANENGVKKWHVKHILVATNGFEQWLTNQIKDISVTTFRP